MVLADPGLVIVQVDQKNVPPPSRAEMKNPAEKLSIAFSNTTYLNIICGKFREESPKLGPVLLASAKRSIFDLFCPKTPPNGLKIA